MLSRFGAPCHAWLKRKHSRTSARRRARRDRRPRHPRPRRRHPDPATSSTAPAAAIAAIVDGRDYFVGTNLDPGAYRQASDTPDCRWSVTDPITGDVIEQGTPGTGPATVNLGKDTRFRADGCGPWVAAG